MTNKKLRTSQSLEQAAPAQRARSGESLVIPNLVDFSAPIFYRSSGSQVYSDIGTSRHGGVFVDGLRFSSDSRITVQPDGSSTSSALQNSWVTRINAMHGEMSEVSFKLMAGGNVPVSYYDAAGQLIKTVMVAGSHAGTVVSFTAPEDHEIAYFTVGSTSSGRYTIDDIDYTVDGTSTLVNFTNATFKYADGTVETRGFFDLGAVFLGSLEINSSNTMYQFPRNNAANDTDANHLGLYGWAATTFTLHKQFVYTVSFDAEFRGADNEIVFYDADNNEIGRISRGATEGHGNMDFGARVWEHVEFNSGGPAIAYFIINAGKPGVSWGHRGVAIDNISYPQTEGPVAARSLTGSSDAVVGDDISEVAALSLLQDEQTPAREPVSAAATSQGVIEPVEFAPVGEAIILAQTDLSDRLTSTGEIPADKTGPSGSVATGLVLGDLLDQGAPVLFGADAGNRPSAAATGDGKEPILLAGLKQAGPEEGAWAFGAPPDDALPQVFDHSGMQVESLVGSVHTQTAALV